MSGSRRENAYVNFDLHKKNHFCTDFLQMYSVVPQNRMRADFFHFHTILGRKCD